MSGPPRLDPETLSPEGEAALARARSVLGLCAVFWAIALGLFIGGQLVPPDLSADEHRTMLLGHISGTLLSAGGAPALRPGSRGGWGVGVIAACAQLATCLLAPAGLYLLYLLFKPQVMRACLGRSFGRPRS